jgi:hypothetical protein
LLGGRIGCDASGIAGGVVGLGVIGLGVVGGVVLGWVVGGETTRGELCGAADVGVGATVVATGASVVVVDVDVGASVSGSGKPTDGRDPIDPKGAGVDVATGAGSNAVKATRVRATRVTVPTRAELPATGIRRSKTRSRVRELDTTGLSAWHQNRLRHPRAAASGAPAFSRLVTTPRKRVRWTPGTVCVARRATTHRKHKKQKESQTDAL